MRRINYYLVFCKDKIFISKRFAVTEFWHKIEKIYNADYDYIYTAYGKYRLKDVKTTPLIYRMVRERHKRIGWEQKDLAFKE